MTEPRTPTSSERRTDRARLLLVFGAGVLVTTIGYGVYSMLSTRAAGGPIRSLAVLPLDNFSGDPEQQYFVDGMTEALISQLGQIDELTVISRTSAMRFRDSDRTLPEIARELNVDAVVEGSVYRAGDEIRITAQLVQAEPERHLWANDYQRQIRDVLALQADVARSIAREIAVTLSPAQERQLRTTRTVDPAAHDAYLRGRYLWSQRDPEALERALAYFRQALEIDPTYARAHGGVADVYVVPAHPLPPNQALPLAKAAARRALELDSALAEAHTSLAYATMTYDWDWETAGREFRRALELNPNYATGHQWYAEYLAARGDLEEAVDQVRRAETLDPLSPVIVWNVARILFFAGRFEEAEQQARKALEVDPGSWMARVYRTGALQQLDRPDAAFDVYRELLELAGDPAGFTDGVRQAVQEAYRDSGWKGVWKVEVREFRECQPHPEHCAGAISAATALGEIDTAFGMLEELVETRNISFFVVDLAADPQLEPLRDDPRYADIMGRIGLSGVGPVERWPATSPGKPPGGISGQRPPVDSSGSQVSCTWTHSTPLAASGRSRKTAVLRRP